jgi:carnitine O-acetyltransferase
MHRYLSLSAKKMVTSASRSYQRQAGSSLLAQQKRLISPSSSKLLARHSSSATASISTIEGDATSLKPWPQPTIESNGDYRAEAFLEQHIGGPLYAHQATLPRLPIPNVEDTITKFLPTALPLAESEEEKQTLLDASASFPTDAVELQRRLQTRRDGAMKDSSWLQLWWNTMGYLQVRDPVVVNVSYFFHFSDDGTLPAPSEGKSLGVMRGASMLVAAADYRKMVCSGSLPCEAIGRKDSKTPLCSVAFKYMFNACRIPAREQDSYKMYDPSLHQHCIVARKGYFFSTKFVDESGDPLPLEVMESKLQRIVQLADDAEARGDSPMLGWLSSNDRDSWADARDELLKAGGSDMEAALEKLQSGALLLCLDDEVSLRFVICRGLLPYIHTPDFPSL